MLSPAALLWQKCCSMWRNQAIEWRALRVVMRFPTGNRNKSPLSGISPRLYRPSTAFRRPIPRRPRRHLSSPPAPLARQAPDERMKRTRQSGRATPTRAADFTEAPCPLPHPPPPPSLPENSSPSAPSPPTPSRPRSSRNPKALHRTGLASSLASTVFGLAVLVALIAARFGPKVQRVVGVHLPRRLSRPSSSFPRCCSRSRSLNSARHLRPPHLASLRAQRAGLELLAGRLGQSRTAHRRLCHPHRMGPVRDHSPGSHALVVLRLAAHPAHHGRHGLCRARPHRSALQPL